MAVSCIDYNSINAVFNQFGNTFEHIRSNTNTGGNS